jgi:hypothetical protein
MYFLAVGEHTHKVIKLFLKLIFCLFLFHFLIVFLFSSSKCQLKLEGSIKTGTRKEEDNFRKLSATELLLFAFPDCFVYVGVEGRERGSFLFFAGKVKR